MVWSQHGVVFWHVHLPQSSPDHLEILGAADIIFWGFFQFDLSLSIIKQPEALEKDGKRYWECFPCRCTCYSLPLGHWAYFFGQEKWHHHFSHCRSIHSSSSPHILSLGLIMGMGLPTVFGSQVWQVRVQCEISQPALYCDP